MQFWMIWLCKNNFLTPCPSPQGRGGKDENMPVNITINGTKIEAEAGQTILDVAHKHGFDIPTLCYHKDLSPTGNCRMCVVEVKGGRCAAAAWAAAWTW